MKRRPHFIRVNTSRDYPQQAIWFDTETNLRLSNGELITLEAWKALNQSLEPDERATMEVTHELRIGYACYKRRHRDGKWTDTEWREFTTRAQFWEFVCSKLRAKTRLFLFCHNTSFDLPVLDVFHALPALGFTLRTAIIDAPPTVLKFIRGSESVTILDTLNIWRMPLAQLGEKIGLAKLPMPDNNDMTIDWEQYGKRDVEIMMAACIDWWRYLEANNMGGFGVTLASQSMLLFRAKYMKHRIFIDTNEQSLTLTRGGYYGGRVEAFRIGEYREPFFSLDVNSMYPSVMQREKFPLQHVGYTSHASVTDLRVWLRRYSVCARVLLETSEPFAPVRTKHKLIFPVGTFECILSTPELIFALEHAQILAVREVAVYDHDFLFREMMDDLQLIKAQAKRDGDLVKEFHTKKLQNSFYGKWGQNGTKWQEFNWIDDLTCKNWIEYDMETSTIIHHRQFAGLEQTRLNEGESRESFPAIAAHVTAYARMDLWRLIRQAGTANTYYCDTDCIVVNQQGYDRVSSLIHATDLGAIKLAGEYDSIQIWGSKDYRFGEKAKTKGVRKDATWLNGWTVSQEQWSGLKGLVRDDLATAPRTKKIVKTLKREYTKGVVDSQGCVFPHRLNLSTVADALQLIFDPESLV